MGYSKFKFKAPDVNRTFVFGNQNYNKPHIIQGNKRMIAEVEKNYGKIIDKWADVFEIDRGIIVCFICTESGGKNAPRNKFNATGLMQVTPNTVYEVITKWDNQVAVPLTQETKNIMNRFVPSTSKWSSQRTPTSAETSQILSGLTKVEYNIFVGTACIRWLIEAFDKLGVGGLDKVMVAYNAGYYRTRNRIKNLTTTQIVENKSLPFESRSYVLKMLGVNGFMDLYFNKKNND